MGKKLFYFNTSIDAESNYTFEVASFESYQEIGELFRYEIDLLSETEVDLDKILEADITFRLHAEGSKKDTYVHGVLQSIAAHQKIDNYIYYKAVMVPKLWWLTLAENQQVFIKKPVTEVIESIFKDLHLTSNDYAIQVDDSYNTKVRDYICQYKESRFAFIQRWMHRNGMYFYFESDDVGSKVIVANKKDSAAEVEEIVYKPAFGLQGSESQGISSIVYRSKKGLDSVHMKDYDYENPSLDISKVAGDNQSGYTQSYLYGNHLRSKDEAETLSDINLQKYQCLDKEMMGESNIRALNPGAVFKLKEYFTEALNDKEYLMVRVESEGSQTSFYSHAIQNALSDGKSTYSYKNTFMMIPAETPYRMQRSAPWPHISGTLSAFVDLPETKTTAVLDDQGRYKIRMPFDLAVDPENQGKGKASAYVRMAQPSAGETQGMHFPLHAGTEVLISFNQGDPDQPVIMGAVPNKETPSPVIEGDETQNKIVTASGTYIEMDDAPPSDPHYIMMAIDKQNYMRINKDTGSDFKGAKGDKGDKGEEANSTEKWVGFKDDIFDKSIGIHMKSEGSSNTLIEGNTLEMRKGQVEVFNLDASVEITVGAKNEINLLEVMDISYGGVVEIKGGGVFEMVLPISKNGKEWEKVISPQSKAIKRLNDFFAEEDRTVVENRRLAIETYTRNVNTLSQNIEAQNGRVGDLRLSITQKNAAVETLNETIEELQHIVGQQRTNVEGLYDINATTMDIKGTTSLNLSSTETSSITLTPAEIAMKTPALNITAVTNIVIDAQITEVTTELFTIG